MSDIKDKLQQLKNDLYFVKGFLQGYCMLDDARPVFLEKVLDKLDDVNEGLEDLIDDSKE